MRRVNDVMFDHWPLIHLQITNLLNNVLVDVMWTMRVHVGIALRPIQQHSQEMKTDRKFIHKNKQSKLNRIDNPNLMPCAYYKTQMLVKEGNLRIEIYANFQHTIFSKLSIYLKLSLSVPDFHLLWLS